MKQDNVLGVDLDELWPRRTMLDFLPKTRTLFIGALTLLALLWASYSAKSLVNLFGHRPFPMYLLEWGQSAQHAHQRSYYHFTNTHKSFSGLDLSRIRELPKSQFEELILSSTTPGMRPRLERYLSLTLKLAEKYQVDPFWVISVMWTESHFNPKAISRVSAQGLMQVMPGTGEYLVKKMHRLDTLYPISSLKGVKGHKLPLQDPMLNIEMGVYYLSLLRKQFNGNYRLATVAYNMGPNGVRSRLRRNLPTGVRNLYLNKVRAAHAKLTLNYQLVLAQTKPPYKDTFVVAQRFLPKTPVLAEIDPLAPLPFKLPAPKDVPKFASVLSYGPVSHL